MANLDEIVKNLNKHYGNEAVKQGAQRYAGERIPTGWFPFDLATGGGFPMGGTSVVYGPESSMKTSIALRAIAQSQLLYPDKKCCFFDLEAAFDPTWATRLGVDTDKILYSLPPYAERAVDLVISVLEGQDAGVIVVDSLAAMIPENEATSSAEKASVGSAGLLLSKFYRKMTNAAGEARESGRTPTLILINQIRHKVGVMYGNPETMPGGWAMKYGSALTVRLFGKNKEDTKISPEVPPYKEINGEIKKWRCEIGARSFKFDVATLDIPEHDLHVGTVDAWNTVSTYLKKYGMLTQEKSGKPWVCMGEEYKTQSILRERLEVEVDFAAELEASLINRAMGRATV